MFGVIPVEHFQCAQRALMPDHSGGKMPKAGGPEASEATASGAVSLLGDMGGRVMHGIVMYALGRRVDQDIAPALSAGQHGGVRVSVDRQTFEAFEFDR
jgi:hypothetical protein